MGLPPPRPVLLGVPVRPLARGDAERERRQLRHRHARERPRHPRDPPVLRPRGPGGRRRLRRAHQPHLPRAELRGQERRPEPVRAGAGRSRLRDPLRRQRLAGGGHACGRGGRNGPRGRGCSGPGRSAAAAAALRARPCGSTPDRSTRRSGDADVPVPLPVRLSSGAGEVHLPSAGQRSGAGRGRRRGLGGDVLRDGAQSGRRRHGGRERSGPGHDDPAVLEHRHPRLSGPSPVHRAGGGRSGPRRYQQSVHAVPGLNRRGRLKRAPARPVGRR